MVEKVIWPAYLDADRPRSGGRRVPQSEAVSAPTVEEIAKAIQQVGYTPVIERDVAYPRDPWEDTGRVRVTDADDASKNDLLRATAAYVAAMRD